MIVRSGSESDSWNFPFSRENIFLPRSGFQFPRESKVSHQNYFRSIFRGRNQERHRMNNLLGQGC